MHGHHVEKDDSPGVAATPGSFLGLRCLDQGSINEHAQMLVLADGDMLTAEQLKHIDLVADNALKEIRCQAHKGASGWSLTQLSPTVSCTVNDGALAYGETVAVRTGDRVELGMLRLVVMEDTVIDDESIQVLTTLADEARGHSMPDAAMDTFAHLPRFEPDTRGDALAFYAGSPTKQDVIDELASQYVMAVTDGSAMHKHQTAMGPLPGTAPAFATVQDVEKKIPAHFSLEDVLSGQLSIEQVLTGIGDDNAQWDKPEAVDDVLMLFADGIARREQSHLPDLTRREHHAVSPDSHVAMG